MLSLRARFVDDSVQEPKLGSIGDAFPASGYAIHGSCEQGAYLFVPDGQENAYYCDPARDLEFLPTDATGAAQ